MTTRTDRRRVERNFNKAKASKGLPPIPHLSDLDECYRCGYVREGTNEIDSSPAPCPACNHHKIRFDPLYVPDGVLAVTTGEKV